jgi:hypothetical protein
MFKGTVNSSQIFTFQGGLGNLTAARGEERAYSGYIRITLNCSHTLGWQINSLM